METTGVDTVFWIAALVGSGVFVLRAVLLTLGGDHSGDVDAPDVDLGDAGHGHAFIGLISVDSLAAFAMTFGWAGLACLNGFKLSPELSSLIAILVGLVCLVLVGVLLKSLLKLQSSGADYSLEQTVGKQGVVYLRIPAEGSGQVQISVGGALKEVDAISEDHVQIQSQAVVEVVRVVNPELLAVRAVR